MDVRRGAGLCAVKQLRFGAHNGEVFGVTAPEEGHTVVTKQWVTGTRLDCTALSFCQFCSREGVDGRKKGEAKRVHSKEEHGRKVMDRCLS